jgi:glycyl-tRNA synthetase
VLSFPPAVAPIKVLICPLSSNPVFKPLVGKLSALLRRRGIFNTVDDSSASIGKRYSRNDQLGTPFGITIDFESVKSNTFTLRERDSTAQVRGTEAEIVDSIVSLVNGDETWEAVAKRLPKFEGQGLDESEPAEKEN